MKPKIKISVLLILFLLLNSLAMVATFDGKETAIINRTLILQPLVQDFVYFCDLPVYIVGHILAENIKVSQNTPLPPQRKHSKKNASAECLIPAPLRKGYCAPLQLWSGILTVCHHSQIIPAETLRIRHRIPRIAISLTLLILGALFILPRSDLSDITLCMQHDCRLNRSGFAGWFFISHGGSLHGS
jgi:hypothetical protein